MATHFYAIRPGAGAGIFVIHPPVKLQGLATQVCPSVKLVGPAEISPPAPPAGNLTARQVRDWVDHLNAFGGWRVGEYDLPA